jgi:hypothetical protein
MQRLSLEQFDDLSEHYDEIVLRTPDIDRFCTSSFWVLPSAVHLMGNLEAAIYRESDSFVVLLYAQKSDSHRVLVPLDALWCLPCPLVGSEVHRSVELFSNVCASLGTGAVVFLSGIPVGSSLMKALTEALGKKYTLSYGHVTRRYLVNLGNGVEGFLSRRSMSFRRSIRRAEARARDAGLVFEDRDSGTPEEEDLNFARILDVERRSWKGTKGVGIDREPMLSFYREMNRRLAARGARRLAFARLDGEDVGYVLGARFHETYRGLQFSFDERYAKLGLGNLCQIREMRRTADAGMSTYDLGTEVEYKKRWADEVFGTLSLYFQL